MNQIPDWAWKLLQLLIIPVALWAIATHVSIQQTEYRLGLMEGKVNQNDSQLEAQMKDISNTQKDIEILKVRMDYVATGIDDIKQMLKEDKENQRYAK
jgi:hypothetical protein